MRESMSGQFSKWFSVIIIAAVAALAVAVTVKSCQPDRVEELSSEEAVCAEDFPVKSYTWNEENFGNQYLLTVKNNSKQTMDFECNVSAFNKEGKYIGVSYNRINCIAPGDTGCMKFDYDSVGMKTFSHTLFFELSEKESGAGQIRHHETRQGQDVKLTVENTSAQPVKYVRADVIFLKKGKAVDYAMDYIHGEDTEEIAAQDTAQKTLTSKKDYDSYQVFYSCQRAE